MAARSSTKELYSADATNFTAEVNKIAAAKPDAIVLIAFDETKKIIPQLDRQGHRPAGRQIYFVDGNTADYSKDFPKGTLDGRQGDLPGRRADRRTSRTRLLKTDPKLKDFTYGPESYDATILIALAAIAAKSTTRRVVRSGDHQGLRRTARSARRSRSAPTCSSNGEDIDYDGVSGPVDLNDTGSPTKATIGIFQYGADNKYKNLKYVTGVDLMPRRAHDEGARPPGRAPSCCVGGGAGGRLSPSWPACRGRAR